MTDTVRVPREPTPEMLKAGASTLDDFWKAQERGPTHVQEAWPGIVQIYAAMLAASPQGEGSSATPIPTETAAAAVVSVPRDQLETLRRSLELGNLLPGEGESLIILWLMIADAEART